MNFQEKNKKLIFLTIIMSLVIMMTPVVASASTLMVRSSSDKAQISDEITITISLDSETKAKSGGVEITFDGSLAYVSGSAKFKVQGTKLDNYDESTHKGAWAFDDKKTVSGDILTLKFKARYDGTPKVGAKVTLRDGNNIVLEESSSVSITIGTGINPTGETTSEATSAQGDISTKEAASETGAISSDAQSTKYPDADNSIFRRADGSVNITLIIIIIAVILIAITVVVVIIYNKRESGQDTEAKSGEAPLLSDENSKEKEKDE